MASKNKESNNQCCVCLDNQELGDNVIFSCDGKGCGVKVHKGCYGIAYKSQDSAWFCRKCESQERVARVRCELCPSKEGALKRTDKGGWCHVVCALFLPEADFVHQHSLEPINLDKVSSDRMGKMCFLCEKNNRIDKATNGACITCNKPGCKVTFHVTCALSERFLLEEKEGRSKQANFVGYCSQHAKKPRRGFSLRPVPQAPSPPAPILDPPIRPTSPLRRRASTASLGNNKTSSSPAVANAPDNDSSEATISAPQSPDVLQAEEREDNNPPPGPAPEKKLVSAAKRLAKAQLNAKKKGVGVRLSPGRPPGTRSPIKRRQQLLRSSNTTTAGVVGRPGRPGRKRLEPGALQATKRRKETNGGPNVAERPAKILKKNNDHSTPRSKVKEEVIIFNKNSNNNTSGPHLVEDQKLPRYVPPPRPRPWSELDLHHVGPVSSTSPTLGSHAPNCGGGDGCLTMEELLECQWDQAGVLLMQLSGSTDIVSLLSCLHQLKNENDDLELKAVRLTKRRDHLRTVNARLLNSLDGGVVPTPPLSLTPAVNEAKHQLDVKFSSMQQSGHLQQSPHTPTVPLKTTPWAAQINGYTPNLASPSNTQKQQQQQLQHSIVNNHKVQPHHQQTLQQPVQQHQSSFQPSNPPSGVNSSSVAESIAATKAVAMLADTALAMNKTPKQPQQTSPRGHAVQQQQMQRISNGLTDGAMFTIPTDSYSAIGLPSIMQLQIQKGQQTQISPNKQQQQPSQLQQLGQQQLHQRILTSQQQQQIPTNQQQQQIFTSQQQLHQQNPTTQQQQQIPTSQQQQQILTAKQQQTILTAQQQQQNPTNLQQQHILTAQQQQQNPTNLQQQQILTAQQQQQIAISLQQQQILTSQPQQVPTSQPQQLAPTSQQQQQSPINQQQMQQRIDVQQKLSQQLLGQRQIQLQTPQQQPQQQPQTHVGSNRHPSNYIHGNTNAGLSNETQWNKVSSTYNGQQSHCYSQSAATAPSNSTQPNYSRSLHHHQQSPRQNPSSNQQRTGSSVANSNSTARMTHHPHPQQSLVSQIRNASAAASAAAANDVYHFSSSSSQY